MNLIPTAISQGVARAGLSASKNAPAILFGVGVAGMLGSTVLACKSTLKLDETLDKTRKELKRVKTATVNGYTEKDRRHDIAVTYRDGIFKIVKLYGPSILMGAAAIACLAKSHNILVRRNAAISAAYMAVHEAFEKYRSRVREKYGVEEDLRMMHDTEPVDIINEKGNITHTTRVSGEPSLYARFFDQLSPEWTDDPDYNLVWLKSQQTRFNHLLHARGHVFLNEVYKGIGLDHTGPGSVVGWVLTNDGSTDNYIDFGLYEDNESARNFVNGRENAVLLDFNVDGLIWDKLSKSKQPSRPRPATRLQWQS
jgi:hypothetical protein